MENHLMVNLQYSTQLCTKLKQYLKVFGTKIRKTDFQGLLVSIQELLWYIGAHENKFKSRNFPTTRFFEYICMLMILKDSNNVQNLL